MYLVYTYASGSRKPSFSPQNPSIDVTRKFIMMKNIRLIPFVCGAGASTVGCEKGPAYLYEAGLCEALDGGVRAVRLDEDPRALYEAQAHYYHDLPDLGTEARKAIVMENCLRIAERVEAVVRDGAMPVTIGGDHAIAAGSIAGFARAKAAHGRVGVIWVDAHADLNTFEISSSKAMHGMSCLLYTSPSPRDLSTSRMPSSA